MCTSVPFLCLLISVSLPDCFPLPLTCYASTIALYPSISLLLSHPFCLPCRLILFPLCLSLSILTVCPPDSSSLSFPLYHSPLCPSLRAFPCFSPSHFLHLPLFVTFRSVSSLPLYSPPPPHLSNISMYFLSLSSALCVSPLSLPLCLPICLTLSAFLSHSPPESFNLSLASVSSLLSLKR
jgi:hypothetical protein